MLKELKSRYAGKCVKCGRELKVNWTIFYDSDTKEVYCQPCGKLMSGPEQQEVPEESNNSLFETILNEISGQVQANTGLINMLDEKLIAIAKEIERLSTNVVVLAAIKDKKKPTVVATEVTAE